MGFYLMQGNYPTASVKAMIDKPHDRGAAVQTLIASAGGKLHHFFFTMGECDWLALCEMPDDIAAASVSMAVGASGGVSGFKTTKLMTSAEAMATMQKAASLSYSAPSAS